MRSEVVDSKGEYVAIWRLAQARALRRSARPALMAGGLVIASPWLYPGRVFASTLILAGVLMVLALVWLWAGCFAGTRAAEVRRFPSTAERRIDACERPWW